MAPIQEDSIHVDSTPPSEDDTSTPTPSKDKGKKKLADEHLERYVVQPDFIEETDESTDGVDDSEVEEEINMEEDPNVSTPLLQWTTRNGHLLWKM